jgi:hypothetical protein
MRKATSGALSLLIAVSLLLTFASTASANVIAGGGFSSSYAGESVFTNNAAGETGQMSAIFFNDGSQPWTRGAVGLLICAADKVTCNVPGNSAFNKNWFSPTVYATVSTTVAPGQNGFFIYDFTVPAGTPAGTVTTFYGDVGLIATGAELRPEGYFQINTTPTPVFALQLSPTSASVQVGASQQFTASGQPTGATVNWSVNGGCGAITAVGQFVATAMNSASQPCTVVAQSGASTGTAAVTVYGTATQLGCTVTPSSVIANGGGTNGTAVAKISLKDANGNVVTNASSPQVNISNVTPSLATVTPSGLVTPSGGVATTTVATTSTPGDIQISASASGLTGCNVILTSSGPGAATKTISTFLTNPIAADTTSTTSLQVDVTDANGNRTSDSTTVLTVTRDAGSANVCSIVGVTQGTSSSFSAGGGGATASSGRVKFTVQATSTPGQCLMITTTNNSSIAGSSAALTTQIVGAANKLGVVSNDSPHAASNTGTCTTAGGNTDVSCTTLVVAVQDVNGAQITSDNGRTINAIPDSNTCSGAGGGNVTVRATTTTTSGKATFALSSAGAYPQCTITFTSSNVSSVNANATWTPGGADHLACSLTPSPLPPDNAATANGAVTVRDAFNNIVTTGTYSVLFTRMSGTANTTIINGTNPQNTSGGYANWTVKSGTVVGTDTYGPSLSSGTLPGANTSCQLVIR